MQSRKNENDLEKTRQLLTRVFPNSSKFEDKKFLDWEYNLSPSGSVIQTNMDYGSERIGHYALVPQRWVHNGEEICVALSLNTAILKQYRMRGQFTKLAEETFSVAEKEGVDAIVGVANENSTWAFVNRLGFKNLGAIETRILIRKSLSHNDFAKRISIAEVALLVQQNSDNLSEVEWFCRIWDDQEIKWRLSCPNSKFECFLVNGAIVVATVVKYRRVSVSVVLKILNLEQPPPIGLQRIVNEICKHQNTYAAVYSGINPSVRMAGMFLPNRIRPAPLNLIFKPLSQRAKMMGIEPTVFEFLDFDAY
jgi:hypothetical protein